MPLQATSGAASYDAFGGGVAAVPQYIEDVFSTYLYTGTGATQTITNGIDLSGKGGLVWMKTRSAAYSHFLADTARGVDEWLRSNTSNASGNANDSIPAFNSNGFTVGTYPNTNDTGVTFASWTFRKQPKFFDVVTYTGNGAASRNIAHNLGSTPGCIISKPTSTTGSWGVYHRTLGADGLYLNGTNSAGVTLVPTGHTSTTFEVADGYGLNNVSSVSYVAYLFAHDAGGFGLTGTDNVISCGSVTLDGSGNASVTLGYEPQWILYKRTDSTSNWGLVDNMRGMPATGLTPTYTNENHLYANLSNAEGEDNGPHPNATGFQFVNTLSGGSTVIYIAIRRGPMKVPTSGTSVFNPYAYTANGTTGRILTGASAPNADLVLQFNRAAGCGVVDRLRGFKSELGTYDTGAESPATYGITAINSTSIIQNDIGGFYVAWNFGSQTYVSETFARAPSFLDVVCYTGTGVAGRTVTHNLTVVPELMIVKARSQPRDWLVYSSGLTTDYFIVLNSSAPQDNSNYAFIFGNNTVGIPPTSSVFTVGSGSDTNANGSTYVAYLFATCAGVSKVGSYTGTATTKQIDCGFTGGARFVLIKRTDSTGDWYVWDSARGIVAGNDPYKILNSSTAEVTNTDYVDAYSAGFEISSTAPAAINASGGTFIFLAIA